MSSSASAPSPWRRVHAVGSEQRPPALRPERAHGIWNLARSAAEFRQALGEASRVARPGAGLFLFTFSRHTFPPETQPVAGEPFAFTQFSGQPQCFLDPAQLVSELAAARFTPDPGVPLTEYNRPRPGTLPTGTAVPVIYEAAFRHAG